MFVLGFYCYQKKSVWTKFQVFNEPKPSNKSVRFCFVPFKNTMKSVFYKQTKYHLCSFAMLIIYGIRAFWRFFNISTFHPWPDYILHFYGIFSGEIYPTCNIFPKIMKQSHPSILEWMYLKTGQLLLNAKYSKVFKYLKYSGKW